MYLCSEAVSKVSIRDLHTYLLIERLVNFGSNVLALLPKNIHDPFWPNCHSICRAIKVMLNERIEVVDGSIAGIHSYEINGNTDIIHRKNGSIQHSWLTLQDNALVDPFPAGVFSRSPLLFPPFGKWQSVFPTNVYIPSSTPMTVATTPEVWEKVRNITHILSFFPGIFTLAESGMHNPDSDISAAEKLAAETIIKEMKCAA